MAHARGFQNRSNRGSVRRLTEWTLGPGGSGTNQSSATGSTVLGSGIQAAVGGLTIVRLRGSMSSYLESATSAKDGFHCALGIGVVTAEAFAVGITAIPTPITDQAQEIWLYHRFFDLHAAGAAAIDTFQSSIQFEVDSKAMRKWPEPMTIYAALEVVEIGAAVMQTFFESRMLVKLP